MNHKDIDISVGFHVNDGPTFTELNRLSVDAISDGEGPTGLQMWQIEVADIFLALLGATKAHCENGVSATTEEQALELNVFFAKHLEHFATELQAKIATQTIAGRFDWSANED